MAKSLLDHISDAEKKGVALGHFNISDPTALRAIVGVAKEFNIPVIIGVSEGERDYLGVDETAALIEAVRLKSGQPVFLNADHTYSVERIMEAADAGFDSVIYDGAKLSFEENVEAARQAVKYVKRKKSRSGKKILVEGELGYIGTSSKVLDEVPEGAALSPEAMTSPEEAAKFAKLTGVDLLAPAVGNIHGMLAKGHDPNLDIPRIKAIRLAAKVPLVLHGGSGTEDRDFTEAIKAGIGIVHINTEIRVAWRQGLEATLAKNPKEIAPYKILPGAEAAVAAVVRQRLKLFNGLL